jgi:hypothetical protein
MVLPAIMQLAHDAEGGLQYPLIVDIDLMLREGGR